MRRESTVTDDIRHARGERSLRCAQLLLYHSGARVLHWISGNGWVRRKHYKVIMAVKSGKRLVGSKGIFSPVVLSEEYVMKSLLNKISRMRVPIEISRIFCRR